MPTAIHVGNSPNKLDEFVGNLKRLAHVDGEKMRAKLRPSIRISDTYRPHHLFNPCDFSQ